MDGASWKKKHQNLLNKTIKELEESTLVAQRAAEENAEASQKLISELRSQLQRSQEKIKTLEDKLKAQASPSIVSVGSVDEPDKRKEGAYVATSLPISLSSDENGGSDNENMLSSVRKRRQVQKDMPKRNQEYEFFESITCLSVECTESNDLSTTYLCSLDDGALMGHEFKITLSRDNWEYTYTPINPSKSIDEGNQLKNSFFFPDYMLPRFLVKLLNATYQLQEGEQY